MKTSSNSPGYKISKKLFAKICERSFVRAMLAPYGLENAIILLDEPQQIGSTENTSLPAKEIGRITVQE